ncbi:hypothetical protein BJ508DRAFT_205695 [Ascobolus immersus RN42]|uniref:ISWI chromatin-remodeling complex ATPase ISW2 n=1 Tax=Ascobolus immersus RN42 TaxID=1160509 RepID=A0A3N4IHU5_ASCIM|nr:hypothetical protein BJ508DRAFT_205695 [Ascobolus immersus RN42]
MKKTNKQSKKVAQEDPQLTLRNSERRTLDATKIRRDRFYIHYRDLFERLLPERNYISRMVERREAEKDDDFEVVEDVVPYKLLESQPEHVKATMKPYQIAGLSYLVWLYKNGVSGILGDEMGLGKTLQTLSLFSYLTTYEPVAKGHKRPFLVVCPLSVMSSWIAECERWTPHLRALRFHGPAAELANIKKSAQGYDVVITTYEAFEKEKTWFSRAFVWRYVVLDEGHKIKNEKSLISRALQGIRSEFRLILTGTPLQNNMQELWALLHWLYPDVFTENTSRKFEEAFNLTLGKNDIKFMDYARLLLELIMLRRMKDSKGVDLNLPPKTELLLYLPLTPMQRFWYKRLLTRVEKNVLQEVFSNPGKAVEAATELAGLDDATWAAAKKAMVQSAAKSNTAEGNKWQRLMNLVMQLRKCCSHPYLLPGAEPEPDTMDYASASAALMLASTKLIFLDKLVETLCIKEGRKVLIFSGFTRMLDVVEDFLLTKGGNNGRFKFGRLDGGTSRARRSLGIHLFNRDSDYKIMLISTRAGGLGINLATASDVVMLDTDWNPQQDLQAQARAHRIGQKNPVTIYRLITQGTVEEQMMGRIRKKLYLSAKVTESMRDFYTEGSGADAEKKGDMQNDMPSMSTGQLLALVRSGSRVIAREGVDVTEMINWDWETLVKKCTDYGEEVAKEEADTAEEERKWLSEIERVEARVFEGKAHTKTATSNKLIAQEWQQLSARKSHSRVVMIDGHAVLKETVGNSEWEAVATFAGKDPTLADPKRARRKITHQETCQICYDGGDLYTCTFCPRVYHAACLDPPARKLAKSSRGSWSCPQHECHRCQQKAANAGGMIFRCRWCEHGYCEDCMDWDKTELVADSLPELELLGFGPIDQAYWIKCQDCVELHAVHPESRQLCETLQREFEEAKQKKLAEEAEAEAAFSAELKRKEEEKAARKIAAANPAKSEEVKLELAAKKQQRDELARVLKTELAAPLQSMLTDASTAESSAVNTPVSEREWMPPKKGKAGPKRKLEDYFTPRASEEGKKVKVQVEAALRFKGEGKENGGEEGEVVWVE